MRRITALTAVSAVVLNISAAAAAIHRVCADGTSDRPTIQAAINVAADGDTVVLDCGVYSGFGNRDLDFLGKAIVVTSATGAADCVTIDCQGTETDTHRGFIFQNHEIGSSVVRGLTIMNGFADQGGAMMCGKVVDSANTIIYVAPQIVDCVFYGNHALDEGGAIYAVTGSSPDLIGCDFIENSARDGGALFFYWQSHSEIRGCDFIQNKADVGGGAFAAHYEHENRISDCRFVANKAEKGGAFYNPLGYSKNAMPAATAATRYADEFTDCEFMDNIAEYGGAVYDNNWCWHTFTNCVFSGNAAAIEGGAVFDRMTHNEYLNCLFTGNAAPRGGAMMLVGEDDEFAPSLQGSRITSTTFANNQAEYGSSLAYAENTKFSYHVSSSIIFGGLGGAAVVVDCPSGPAMSCVDIHQNEGGDWTGYIAAQFGLDGNISLDPRFCGQDNAADPFTLDHESPCTARNNPCGLIGARGVGCNAIPTIDDILDVGNDQGGRVGLSWQRSEFDVPGAPDPIVEYGIYRLQDGSAGPAPTPNHSDKFAGWDYLGAVPAREDAAYQYIAPTTCDSTVTSGMCWSVFMVSARTALPLVHFESPADSGYSVDNLPPDPPVLMISDDVTFRSLYWHNPEVPDLAETCLYRSTNLEFEPADTLVCSAGQFWYFEDHLALYHYRARSFDIHGNVSAWSNVVVGQYPTGAPVSMPTTLRLYPNQPNPFNPQTTINYDVPVDGLVTLRIYDIRGALIRTLVDSSQPRGSHQATWDGRDASGRGMASGSYFARLEAGGEVETMRMGLVR